MMLGLVLLTTLAFGQGTTGFIGTISDPSGAAVPNAKVTITNVDNNFVRTTVTGPTGSYTAPDLQIGHYAIKVEAEGFKTASMSGITLNVGTVSRQDIALELGQKVDSVTVEASAIQVQSDTSDVSSTVTDTQITNLATNGRNILSLTALVPGAATTMPDFGKPVAQYQNQTVNFNGQRNEHNNWIIDGAEAYDRGGAILIVSPSQDSIAEFKVTTSNFGADLGNASGGMITMALKQGTTKYHGSAWEYNRNDALNSYSWLEKQKPNEADRKMKKMRYNTFGFNLGGPVPLGKEKKTFFFYNMEWRRYIMGDQDINSQVPNAAALGGDLNSVITNQATGQLFNKSVTALRVPYTTDPKLLAKFAAAGWGKTTKDINNNINYAYIPGNTIPQTMWNSNYKAYLGMNLIPAANNDDGTKYIATLNTTEMYREESVRLDHQFSDKLTVFGHLIWDNGTEQLPRALWGGNSFATVGSTAKVPSWSGVVHATYTISPTLLNEVSFNTNGNNLNLGIAGNWQIPSGWTTKQMFPAANADNKMPYIQVTTPGPSWIYDPTRMPWTNTWRSHTFKDDVSWAHGAHNVKFGGSIMLTKKVQPTGNNMGGTWRFTGNATGVGLADFMLGLGSSYSQPMYRQTVNIAHQNINLYVNDDWKVSRRLTLNLGLRWEYMPQAYDQNNMLSNFYPDLYDPAQAPTFLDAKGDTIDSTGKGFRVVPQSPIQIPFYMNGIGLAGVNGIPRGLTTSTRKTFAPRVGFAYDLTGKGTVLRGGFGMFYERVQGNEQYNMMDNAPFSYAPGYNNIYLDDPKNSWETGKAAAEGARGLAGITGLARQYDVPTSVQWNLNVQQALGGKAVFTVGYVGNTNYHQAYGMEYNNVAETDMASRLILCDSGCGMKNPGTNLFRPYKGFAGINLLTTEGNSHYNGLQSSIRSSAWKNLTIGAAYTWGHGFDINDGDQWSNLDNPWNKNYNWGSSGFDRRQVLNVNYVYNLPLFKNASGLTKTMLGGWTVSGVTSFQSGIPLNVGGNGYLGCTGGCSNHADQNAPVTYPKQANMWFSTWVFSNVPKGEMRWGTSHRGSVIGPGRNNWNIALFKNFAIGEKANFEFKAESFNTFNHSQWTAVSTNINYDAGKITGAAESRALQLGAKLSF
jgi:hypothetical protein